MLKSIREKQNFSKIIISLLLVVLSLLSSELNIHDDSDIYTDDTTHLTLEIIGDVE